VPDDTEATLHERIKLVERELYPLVVGRVMAAMRDGNEPESIAGTLED
jgi:folate-dependent phosphoribosylglycinamide formyltransferase PurN